MRTVVVNCSSPTFTTGIAALISQLWDDCKIETNKVPSAQDTTIEFDGKTLILLDDASTMRRAFHSRKFDCCAGIVLKKSSAERLTKALIEVDNDEFYIDPACMKVKQKEVVEELTDRQQEILQMFADGSKTEDVAGHLGIATETIRTHTKRILAKLNAKTRGNAIAIAVRKGSID